MSSQNDLIKLNEVIAECTRLLKEQAEGWQSIVKEIKNVNQSAPSQYIKMQREASKAVVDLEKAEQQYQRTLAQKEKVEQQILVTERQRIQTSEALRKANEAQANSINKTAQAEAKAQAQLARATNTYTMVEQRIKVLTQTYNDLATKKELGMKLNDQEVAQLNSLQGRLNQYNEVLKKVDSQIGKNQRNVGNYASGFNGLGNSINQITRELPAFTFSAQTGFLALSNNIPILADEIKRVSNNVAEMRAQGKQVPSVMSQILTSFLSWQTALSIGVTLITVYGKEIGEFFAKIFEGAKKVDKATLAINAYNEALKDTDFQTAYADVNKLGASFEQAEKGTLNKEKALKLYNQTLGSTIGEAKTYNEALKLYTENADRYIEATLRMSVANQFLKKSAEEAAKRIEAGSTAQITVTERFKAIYDVLNQNVLDTKNNGDDPFINFFRALKKTGEDTNKVYSTVMDNRNKKINEAKENEKSFLELAKESLSEYDKLTKNFTGKTEKTKKPKKEKDNTKELLEQKYRLQVARINQMEDGEQKEIELLQAWFEYQQELHKGNAKELLIINLDYWTKLNKINDDSRKKAEEEKKKADKLFLDEQDELFKEDEKNTKEYNDAVQKWKDEADEKYLASQREKDEAFIAQVKKTQEYLMQSTDLGNFGFSSLNIFSQLEENGKTAFENMLENAQDFKEKFAVITNAVGDILKDVLGQMEERQNAYFEQQFKNLETEKDLALQFAGENTAGREAIEKQYEEKKRALQMQQAKQQKQQAMLQATINIAQGITSALAQAPPYSFILAGLVGVLGAVQLAKIASSPLPQFYTGTDNAPEGLALTQERGAEMITDKNGKIKTIGNNKGAQLTYLNKGDKVFTADETTQKLNELLIGSSVAPIVNTSVNNGLTEEQMRNIMKDTLAKQPKNSIIFDENGIKAFASKENRRTILKNRNVKI